MAYRMKRGNSAVPFKELGSSPAKQKDFDIKSEKAKNKRDFEKTDFDLGTTGWEPPVRRSELDEKGKKKWDELRNQKASSPAKQSAGFGLHNPDKETVSKTSPGPGWTKTKGTNIWAPPKGRMMKKEFKQLKKKGKLMKSMSKGVSEAASEKMGLMQKKGKLMKSMKQGVKEGATEAITQLATNKAITHKTLKKVGKQLGKGLKTGKRTITNKMKTKKPVRDNIGTPKMNPPYAKPSGPRERPYPGKGESSGFENFKSNITKPKTKEAMASFRAAQLETKGSDERETKRINP